MPDPDKPMEGPKLGRGRRRGAVIDLQPEDARTIGEPSGDAAIPTAAGPETPEAAMPADSAPAEPAASMDPQPETVAAPRIEPLEVPPAPEPTKSSLALPLVAAAGLGLIFGGVGGAFAPRLMGGESANSARIAILDRAQQQLARDQSGLASMAELEKVREAVARLEAQAAQRAAAPDAAPAPSGLEERIAGLESALKAVADRPAASAAPAVDLKPLQDRIDALQEKLGAIDAVPAEQQALQRQVAALDAALKALDARLASTGQRVEQAEQRLEAGRAAPLFAAVQTLAQTFHRGAPFAAELTAVEALGAPAESLKLLAPFAERGAPTPERLRESFAALAGKLAGDASQPGLMGYVSRFVTVRPTEESSGDTPAAIVGSIEAALRRGDVAAAVANWSRLPEPARNASADWGAEATRRAAAAKALSDLQAASAAALRK